MRYEKGYKEATRNRILTIAAERFRKDGIDSVGLVGLMKAAGLTHGGFYNHFKSKEELVLESLILALEETLSLWREKLSSDKDDFLEELVSFYLSEKHCQKPSKGCAVAALGPEIARRPEISKKQLGNKIIEFFDILAGNLPKAIREERKKEVAMAVFSMMVGALQLARMMPDRQNKEKVLQSAVKSVSTLLSFPN